jgi:hypothetical protein
MLCKLVQACTEMYSDVHADLFILQIGPNHLAVFIESNTKTVKLLRK